MINHKLPVLDFPEIAHTKINCHCRDFSRLLNRISSQNLGVGQLPLGNPTHNWFLKCYDIDAYHCIAKLRLLCSLSFVPDCLHSHDCIIFCLCETVTVPNDWKLGSYTLLLISWPQQYDSFDLIQQSLQACMVASAGGTDWDLVKLGRIQYYSNLNIF